MDWARYAEREILVTYGDKVDIVAKSKSLNKFGLAPAAAEDTPATVSEFQGSEVNETFATDNTIDYVVSDDADTGSLIVEGHTLVNDLMVFVRQDVTLTGTTEVELATPLFRCTRMYRGLGTVASPITALVGNVVAYDSAVGTATDGVVDDDTAVKCIIKAGAQQSKKCATAVSGTDYWLITGISASALKETGSSARVDVFVEFRQLGGVWRPAVADLSVRSTNLPSASVWFEPYRIIPSNSDVRMVAISDTSSAVVGGAIHGILAGVI